MTEQERKLDEGAAKLDEGAKMLDEGAGKLHEGARALHEVAMQMKGDDGSQHISGDAAAELASSWLGATTLQLTRARADRLALAVRHRGARAAVLVKRHPLTALTTLGAAAAFFEAPFAVGLLAGVAGAAFLVNQPGPQARQILAGNSRLMFSRAREAWQRRRPTLAQPTAVPS
jgi:X-X-X-Leu-X-X-Gly heptad repeat protein